jgi:hypothetical protein
MARVARDWRQLYVLVNRRETMRAGCGLFFSLREAYAGALDGRMSSGSLSQVATA